MKIQKHGVNEFVGPVSLKDFKDIPKEVLGNWYKD